MRLHFLSEALRGFGLVDSFGLRALIEGEKLPTKKKLLEHLKGGTKSLPPSISAEFVALTILSALEEADKKDADQKDSPPKFNFKSIKPGKAQAGKYHKQIFQALSYVFSGILVNGVIERNADHGRKRIDIVFENPRKGRFFRDLETRHQIFCPIIFIECKNYTHDPKNPEYDQLSARFHNRRGRFGILVCRSIEDAKGKAARCGDVLSSGNGCIIVLEDSDIVKLVQARAKGDLTAINNLLSKKLTEVLFNAR